MEPAGLLLIASMCLVGGLIAYGADLLGRHLGKQRVSLMGMRPRHTAAVLTTLSGILIPIVTIAVLYSSVREVRVMLSEGSRAAAERDRKVAELDEARQDVDRVNKELSSLNANVSRLSGESLRLEKERNAAQKSLQSSKKALDSTQTNLKRTEGQLQASKQATAVLNRAASLLKKQVAGAKLEVNQLQDTKQALETRIAQVQERLTELGTYQLKQDLELQALERQRDDLSKRINGLEAEKTKLETASDQFLDQIGRLQTERGEVENQINEIRIQRQRLRDEVESLRSLQRDLTQSLGAVRTQPLVYARGEELMRQVIPASSTANGAREALDALFNRAQRTAIERGASGGLGQPAVALIPLVDSKNNVVSVQQQEEQIVRQAAGQKEQQVLILNSLVNCFQGEFVRVSVQVLANNIVYNSGALIAEVRIDGSMSEKAILDSITQFLRNDVGPKAIRDGMIPAAGQEATLGQVDEEEIIRLVTELKEYSRRVRVQAFAAEDTRRADRLKLRLRIR